MIQNELLELRSFRTTLLRMQTSTPKENVIDHLSLSSQLKKIERKIAAISDPKNFPKAPSA